MRKINLDLPVCMARRSTAKNFASSSGEYVDVEISFNLGFGLFKSVVDEIELGVEADAEPILSANDAVEAA
jgi:hypothetical protein